MGWTPGTPGVRRVEPFGWGRGRLQSRAPALRRPLPFHGARLPSMSCGDSDKMSERRLCGGRAALPRECVASRHLQSHHVRRCPLLSYASTHDARVLGGVAVNPQRHARLPRYGSGDVWHLRACVVALPVRKVLRHACCRLLVRIPFDHGGSAERRWRIHAGQSVRLVEWLPSTRSALSQAKPKP